MSGRCILSAFESYIKHLVLAGWATEVHFLYYTYFESGSIDVRAEQEHCLSL